ncbi:MAG: nucleotidyltransferase domain-containing protein [Candidatus Margulisiibacteriota bacterium]|jgi:predicted nucleotidyltransferase
MNNKQKINIKQITQKIVNEFNPKMIYLFGSYAKGTATDLSDLDLLIIDDSARKKNKIALEISKSLFPRNYALELIVASSEEIQLKQEKNLEFWQDILKTSKKLYERK